jgi:hypothetical protein
MKKIILAIIFILLPCAAAAQGAGECFNQYQNWFMTTQPTEKSLDVIVFFRLRAFGSDADKQSAWQSDWRSKFPLWDKAAAGVAISGSMPEVWTDLRQDADGNLIIPPHILGHEVIHIIGFDAKGVTDPDTFAR